MTEFSELLFSVRDYECDLQGFVNNAVYQNYLEHARHVFLKERQIDFSVLANAGTNLVVIKAELDYKGSLTSGDSFIVRTCFTRKSRLKFLCTQNIILQGDDKVLLTAEVICTAINSQGRPFFPKELENLLE